MSSIKCKNCGLVNFSHATECKRCLNPFNNKPSFSSHYQNLQPSPHGYASSEFDANFQVQEKPPCIKCGNKQNISIRNFEKKHVSPVAILGIFFGFLPYLLLRLLLSTTHFLSAPFCQTCWDRFSKAKTISVLNTLGFFVVLVGGIVIAFSIDSDILFVLSFVAAIVTYLFGVFYIGSISPKYKKVDARQVIINAPLVGDVLYTK